MMTLPIQTFRNLGYAFTGTVHSAIITA